MDFSDRNIQRLTHYTQMARAHQQFRTTIEPDRIINCDPENHIHCPFCLNIPRYPIVFKCGHLACAGCYEKEFGLNNKHQGTAYFTSCPICRAQVYTDDLRTIWQEMGYSPDSRVSKFYHTYKARCQNSGCSASEELSLIDQHEMFLCPHRLIKCPANQCPVIGKKEEILYHSLKCVLHFIWCATCQDNWRVFVTSHDCRMSIQANTILGSTRELWPNDYFGEVHGDVLIPNYNLPKSFPDMEALSNIRMRVRMKRGLLLKRPNANIPTRFVFPAHPPPVFFDESTQLPPAPLFPNLQIPNPDRNFSNVMDRLSEH